MPRTRDPNNYVKYEWKPEWRDFIRSFTKSFSKKTTTIIPTNLTWSMLMDSSNSEVTRTRAQGEQLATTLPHLDTTQNVVFTSTDNVRLVVFLRNGLHFPWMEKGKERGTELLEKTIAAIEQLGKTYKPPLPTDKRHLDHKKEQQHYESNNQQYGVYHFCLWKATGRNNDPAVISRDVIENATKLNATRNFFQEIAPLIQTIGMLFEGVDPDYYDQYLNNYNSYLDKTALSLLKVSGRACFLCLAVLRNARVDPHKDAGDVKDGWVAMCCFRDFEGGALVLPDFQIQIDYGTGDVIFFRAAVFEHFVAPFLGDRSVLVFFTKKATWEELENWTPYEAPHH